jgi:uncharacterized protein
MSGGSADDPHAPRRRPFLTAHWRWLVLLSYEIDPGILGPYVPAGTALDLWQGRALVSVVGFRFVHTRVRGLPLPFHRDFDEVNLRFYVTRRLSDGEVHRGVVFIREFVPRAAIALVARLAYNEPYTAVAMRSTAPATSVQAPGRLTYEWRLGGRWQRVSAMAVDPPAAATPRSEAAFITEHYWGYTRQRDGSTVEYEVAHPAWRVWAAIDPMLDVDVSAVYGPAFARALSGAPTSAMIAEGSPVVVYAPHRIAAAPAPSAGREPSAD